MQLARLHTASTRETYSRRARGFFVVLLRSGASPRVVARSGGCTRGRPGSVTEAFTFASGRRVQSVLSVRFSSRSRRGRPRGLSGCTRREPARRVAGLGKPKYNYKRGGPRVRVRRAAPCAPATSAKGPTSIAQRTHENTLHSSEKFQSSPSSEHVD